MHCKIISTVKLINIFITYLPFWVCGNYSLSKVQAHNTVLLAVGSMLHVGAPELILPASLKRCPLAPTSSPPRQPPFHPPLEFSFSRFHKKCHRAVFVFLSGLFRSA